MLLPRNSFQILLILGLSDTFHSISVHSFYHFQRLQPVQKQCFTYYKIHEVVNKVIHLIVLILYFFNVIIYVILGNESQFCAQFVYLKFIYSLFKRGNLL